MLLTLLKKFTNGALKYYRAFCLDDLKWNYQRTEIRWTNLSIVYLVIYQVDYLIFFIFEFRHLKNEKHITNTKTKGKQDGYAVSINDISETILWGFSTTDREIE